MKKIILKVMAKATEKSIETANRTASAQGGLTAMLELAGGI